MLPRVRYVGPFHDYTGYGQATRNIITALFKAQIPVTTEETSFVKDHSIPLGEEAEIAEKLQVRDYEYDVRILHVTADLYYGLIDPQSYNIGHLFWETNRIPSEWVRNCNLMDEIWTGSETGKKAITDSGVTCPVFVFPQPINTEPNNELPLEIKDKKFTFYTIMEWNHRKNPLGLLKAYWEEFTPDDNVRLIMKVFLRDFSELGKKQIQEDINSLNEFKGRKDLAELYLITDAMDYKSIKRLHKTGDCFVSAHHGEGWGIPQVEAMVSETPIITTGYGGVHEYLDKVVCNLVDYKLEKVTGMGDFNSYYTEDQQWAEPDYKHLKELMRWVKDNPKLAKSQARKSREEAVGKFSFEVVGELMKQRLMQIAQEQKWK